VGNPAGRASLHLARTGTAPLGLPHHQDIGGVMAKDKFDAAWGIVNGILISIALWAFIGLAVWWIRS